MGLEIGLDLTDSYTCVSCADDEKAITIPTVICKKKSAEDEWYVGEEAFKCNLLGDGIIVDKLLKMVKKDGTSTINEIKYTAIDILKIYLNKVIELLKKEYHQEKVDSLTITTDETDVKFIDCIMYCADDLGISRKKVHVITHTEAYVYYMVSQKNEIWNNQAAMFDLSDENLCYYEMKVQRGTGGTVIMAERVRLEESFNLDIINNASGEKLADKILSSCAERLLQKKIYSSVLLTGKGFERQDWAEEFMKIVCSKRRVYVENELFSRGALVYSTDKLRDKTDYPYTIVCDGRLHSTITMKVILHNKESQLIVASAGENWYEAKSTIELILDHEQNVDFYITPVDSKNIRQIRIPLTDFPERPNKTTRISVNIGFFNENNMVVLIKDKGFGEIFPATDAAIRQEVAL